MDERGRSVAVPGRSNVQTATRIRQSDAGRFCHVAAPGDGRAPAIGGTIPFGKTAAGTGALPSKVPAVRPMAVWGGRMGQKGFESQEYANNVKIKIHG